MSSSPLPSNSLLKAYQDLRAQEPKLRIRDAAARLEVSEAELVAASVGQGVTRLQAPYADFLQALPSLGRVMTLTRNESAVHETHGAYDKVSIHGQVGLVVGSELDLRIFFQGWDSIFAVEDSSQDEVRRSLQVFDPWGDAVHKIFLEESSDVQAYEALVDRFRSEDQSDVQTVKAGKPEKNIRPDSEIDVPALREAWQKLTDTHDFYPMLQEFKVDRLQALRLVGGELSWPVALDSPRRILESAASSGLPIMAFVGSRGVIQIFSGQVHKVRQVGPWINVLDPDFNLHLREDHVASAWIVRKPTSEGVVTTLEVFDAEGESIALFFGARDRHEAENLEWRQLAESLPTEIRE